MMRALARLGADLEATNDNGSRPLHIVAQEGQALVQLGAQIEAPGAEQHTPLQIAAQCGCVEVVRPLLQLGAAALDRVCLAFKMMRNCLQAHLRVMCISYTPPTYTPSKPTSG